MSSLVDGKRRGAFIVFEGIDRCGKSTQVEMLGKALPNVENIRFPDRTSCIGQLINSYLTSATNMSDQAIHLLFSANRWEAVEGIKAKLESGTTLICDRYAYSGVAFSSSKGLDLDWCVNCDRGLVAPDAIIYLDMPVEDAMKRGDFGAERYEKKDFQEKVRDSFLALKKKDEGGTLAWHRIEARQSKEDLHKEILTLVNTIIEGTGDKPLQALWMD